MLKNSVTNVLQFRLLVWNVLRHTPQRVNTVPNPGEQIHCVWPCECHVRCPFPYPSSLVSEATDSSAGKTAVWSRGLRQWWSLTWSLGHHALLKKILTHCEAVVSALESGKCKCARTISQKRFVLFRCWWKSSFVNSTDLLACLHLLHAHYYAALCSHFVVLYSSIREILEFCSIAKNIWHRKPHFTNTISY